MFSFDSPNSRVLSEKETQKFIEEVRSDEFSPLFDGKHYDVYAIPLDFYDGYSLYALSNKDMFPHFEMFYISNGEDHQYLDGTVFPIQALNKLQAISLTRENVQDYLRLYFLCVFDPKLKIRYISKANESPYSGASAMSHHFKAQKYVAKRNIDIDEHGFFHVFTPILMDSKTLEAEFIVCPNGTINLKSPKAIALLNNELDDAIPSYIHPYEKQILQKNAEVLDECAEGQRLLDFQKANDVNIRVLAGPIRRSFAVKHDLAYIVVPGYQKEYSPYQVLDLAAALYECDLRFDGFYRGDPVSDHQTYIDANLRMNLCILQNLCKICEEMEDKRPRILRKFRKMGFDEIYTAYKNEEDIQEAMDKLVNWHNRGLKEE